MAFEWNPRQLQALDTLSSAREALLEGGSRSGKTFTIVAAIIARALKAPESRHAIFRFAFVHLVASIIEDTWPKVMSLVYPGLSPRFRINRQHWFARFEDNGAEVWFAGLDDKERTERVLGQEYATEYFNEASQIPNSSRLMALTRLAQRCEFVDGNGQKQLLVNRAWYDYNPPSTAHWGYQIFHKGIDPDTKQAVDRAQYMHLQMNPKDNAKNLDPHYLASLERMPMRYRKRFFAGEYADATEGALWPLEIIDRNRVDALPDLQRVVIGVDPSGAGDTDNTDNDEIGVVVAGLGTDGRAYVLEDCTLKAGPGTWGRVVGTAFDRHAADVVCGESNFGGEMVKFTIQTARPGTPYKKVVASRGKVLRAEPVSALYETGKVRHCGTFTQLEDEMCAMTTRGFTGEGSPNRVDALVIALTELFPAVTRAERPLRKTPNHVPTYRGEAAWMA